MLPAAHPLAELTHVIEHPPHVTNNVRTVDNKACVPLRAKRRMQHGAPLGHVYVRAGLHRADLIHQTRTTR
jgi:hypothetical protein